MSSDFLNARKNELEEAFFAKHNAKLLQQLRDKAAVEAERQGLAQASGIRDEKLLSKFIELGLCSETVAALSLVPLIEVAWADGTISARERQAVVAAAEEKGLPKQGPAHELLENWLAQKPQPKLLEVWKHYASALAADLDADSRAALRKDLIGRARAVAEAAGGFLGLGSKVSKAEARMLEDLEKALG